ncbi:FkbM family methyltransferase [Stutzerimonas nosocomialis]|uniref:FkbM family methyltransferase n=1 Tax=Stutzerimonas nosocomialis TaxID=1056496 RepID=UPI0011080543|nr:FkbM family methyltransferase [Stutzerimonas nosocomialis]TLX59278.1 FkbM family methyltransferase [Stutzerimonas nosocomialis]
MKFKTYSQNFEDLMLWRALRCVEFGFYVDVGANDPVVDSVTQAFYEKGWRGINIDPVDYWHRKLEEMRPKDINLNIAAGKSSGEMLLYEFPNTGLSTADASIAAGHAEANGFSYVEKIVPVKTLTEICQEYHVAPIHFLKIDVEGAEKDVIKGIDFTVLKPWIILVESTLPLTQVESHHDWEGLLVSNGYVHAYFDGLNRFYVSDEHIELLKSFDRPPNYFDNFAFADYPGLVYCSNHEDKIRVLTQSLEGIRASLANEKLKTGQLNASLVAEKNKLSEALSKAVADSENWRSLALSAQSEVQLLRASTSWRLTAPFRRFVSFTRPIKISLRKGLARVAVIFGGRLLASPARGKIVFLINKYPPLRAHLKAFCENKGLLPRGANIESVPRAAIRQLSPRASVILHDLHTAFSERLGRKFR